MCLIVLFGFQDLYNNKKQPYLKTRYNPAAVMRSNGN